MKTKEEIEQRLAENKQERKQLKQQLKDLSSLEVGRWYKVFRDEKETSSLVVFNGYNILTYGFTHINRSWTESYGCSSSFRNPDYRYSPATDKEVKEALIKEAKKRGFKEGVKYTNNGGGTNQLKSSDLIYEYVSGVGMTLGTEDIWFYSKGKWAEIIKPKTVNLNGDYTEVQLKNVLNSQF
jgi:hypothetical protein